MVGQHPCDAAYFLQGVKTALRVAQDRQGFD